MEPVGIVAIGAVLAIAGGLHLRRHMRRQSSPLLDRWDGHIVAVDIHITPGVMRYQPDVDSQFTTPILRRPDGREYQGTNENPSKLPKQVRQQIYNPWWVINQNNPNFNLPKDERQAAQSRARDGGYRFALPHPLPVSVEQNGDGEILWNVL